MDAKTIVVTGGTSGIGLAAALALAARGNRLILIGRDTARGRRALELIETISTERHRFIPADLSLISQVRAVVADLEASERSIDVLANNAGTWFRNRELTAEGNERTVATNHLAYVALTLGLERLLTAAPAARVINTGSFVYTQARYDPDNLQSEKRFSTNRTYAATKLYNLMATRALAKRWSDTGITVNCFSPGFVATGFGRGEGGLMEPVDRLLRRLLAISPELGAANLVYLAGSPDVAGVTGRYFDKCLVAAVKGAAVGEHNDDALLKWSMRAVDTR